MSVYKRIGILLSVLFVTLVFTTFFAGIDIKQRILVLGVALDKDEYGYKMYTEVVVPTENTGESNSGGMRRILSGRGKTVSEAFQSLNKYNGHLFSLGQCNLLAICGNLMKNHNVSDCLAYFAYSDAFKDGVTIVGTELSCEDFFFAEMPTETFVTFAVHSAVTGNGKRINVPVMDLLEFVKANATLSACSYVPVISFIQEIQPDASDSARQSMQKCISSDKMAVFVKGEFKEMLDADEMKSFNLVNGKDYYHVFVVDDSIISSTLPRKIAVGNINKSVNTEYSLKNGRPLIKIRLDMQIKRLRTDTDGLSLPFMPVGEREITPDISRQVQNECTHRIEEIYSRLINLDCDILKIYSGFYKSLGAEWTAYTSFHPDWLQNTSVTAICNIS